MKEISHSLKFFLNMAKIQAVMARKFDNRLAGLWFSDFMILYYLSQAPGEKMRRIDLAEKLGLTASGITRLLLPMEKIGLVSREINERDARVSYVLLAPGGKHYLDEGLERAELLCQETVPAAKVRKMEELWKLLMDLGGNIM